MSESVNLPALGESVTEGTVTRWLKNVGDRVEVDEPLLEVSTDKVDTEIPSPIAGIIEEILVAEDETVEVGAPLVRIGTGETPAEPAPDAAAAAPAEAQAAPAPAAEPQAAPAEAAPVAQAAPAEAAPVAQPAPVQQAAPSDQYSQFAPPPAAPQQSFEQPAQQPAFGESAAQAAPVQQAAPAQQEAPAEQAAPQAAPAPEAPSEAPAPETQAAVANLESPSTEAPVPASEQANTHTSSAAPSSEQPSTVSEPEAPAAVAASTPEDAQPVDQVAPAAQPSAPAESTEQAAAPAAEQPSAPANSSSAANAGYVTPLVRKLANERGVDLSTVTGSGVGGRIRKQDVLAASVVTSAPAAAESAPTEPSTPALAPIEISPLRGTTVPMTRLRKVVAERAVISMQSTAQLTSVVEVDVTAVANFRNSVKDEFFDKTGVKLSFLPFFALAATEALQSFPIINATVDGDKIVYPAQENLSIAVDTERGLLTPVIRDAGALDIAGFAAQIADLASRTRENKLKPDELAGGTFTLTNTGSRGALFDTPVVFLPQSAILGTGIVTKRAVVVAGDAIAIRSMVYLALSYDHRIVDGADAARFLVAVKNRLEAGEFAHDLGI